MTRPILLTLLLPWFALACSGNAVVEPGAKQTKRAKAFIEKCQPPEPPEGAAGLKEVYACLPPEDVCPEPGDPETETELGYILEKGGGDQCGPTTEIYDVPCGPDLNAFDCCYVARISTVTYDCF